MGQGGGGLRASNKGETGTEDDVKRQVNSDNKDVRQIYRLVNVKNGGGKLVDIIKSTARISGSGSFRQTSIGGELSNKEHPAVDKQIHDLVEPLLYNGGKGKLVPLSRIWLSRMSKKLDEHQEKSPHSDLSESSETAASYRWVCWKLEERGFVGETALHICFLLSTPTHMILAKKLLALFPMLINDIYTCDEYFGESSLHMAIVNEDIRIVKLLLDHGANVHERCLGSFFLPIDQKDRANDSIRAVIEQTRSQQLAMARLNQFDLKSNQLLGSATSNYDGMEMGDTSYAYWGEYPLSFAACLGLTDCYKLLLAKGADPNRQDSNGNATLHMAVIADRIDVFDLCYSNGADLTILNKQNLNPLSLAAKLKRVDMFFHILTIQRQVNWIFCNVGFAETPLAGIDSINDKDGSCDENSALSIVVFGASSEHLRMLDGLLAQLLTIKWSTAARNRFRLWLGQFFVFVFLSMIAYWSRFARRRPRSEHHRLDESQSSRWVILIPSLSWDQYSELALICFVVYYLWVITSRIVPQFSSSNSIIRSISQAPEISLFSITCLLILVCIPLRLLKWNEAEGVVASLVMFSLPLKFLFFCRASKSVGPFVVVIYRIVANDVLCFVVLLVIFVGGFSQSLQIIFKTHLSLNQTAVASNNASTIDRNYFNHVLDGVLSMHMMAFNEFSFVFDEFDSTAYPIMARALFCIYMILVSILLVNMIIAMLGKTYQDIASQPNENLRQWARALLIVERMWTKSERLRMLDKYSHKPIGSHSAGRKFSLTWSLSEKDLQDIKLSKRLKSDNTKCATRLRVQNNITSAKQQLVGNSLA